MERRKNFASSVSCILFCLALQMKLLQNDGVSKSSHSQQKKKFVISHRRFGERDREIEAKITKKWKKIKK